MSGIRGLCSHQARRATTAGDTSVLVLLKCLELDGCAPQRSFRFNFKLLCVFRRVRPAGVRFRARSMQTNCPQRLASLRCDRRSKDCSIQGATQAIGRTRGGATVSRLVDWWAMRSGQE